MNINDLTTDQIETVARFRHEFPDVTIWPSGEFGIVLLRTVSAGLERVSRLYRDGSFSQAIVPRPSVDKAGSK